MSLRSFIFWPHLVCGLAASVVILIMSVTGVLLTYEKQMVQWSDARRLPDAPAGTPLLPVSVLVSSVREAVGAAPASIVLIADESAPAVATVGQRRVLIDPRTGAFLGDSAPRLRAFFRAVTDWHRWLAAVGENRALGRAVTGWSNLIFAFIVLSGMYLWLPRVWAWRHFRAVTFFRGGLRGKARDFNWHNVIGIWCAVPLFLVVISALPISFPWANALVYRLAGEAPPAAATRGGAAPQAAGRAAAGLPLDGLDAGWTRAQAMSPDWTTITARIPDAPAAPLVFTVDRGTAGQPQLRGTLTIPRVDGRPETWETFDALSTGRRVRSISRFLHTGEVLGVAGQTIAGIASLGGVVLVWTGIALSWRRLRAWMKRSSDTGMSRAA